MPRSRPHTSAPLDLPEPATQPGTWVGWVAYVVIALIGFGFGVWVGNQRPAPPETAKADTPKDETPPDTTPKRLSPDGPDKAAKKQPTPPDKKEPPEVKNPEPKKSEPMPMPPEVKKKEPPPVPTVLFADQIQPIFKAKCNLCHGDTKSPKGDLDLRTLASIAKGGETGKALVPGNLKDSNIWTWIDEGQMPPPDKPQLRDDEKTLIKNWILSGGK
jgi:hypothetical protein